MDKDKAINKAYDYITTVSTTQERLLEFDELYKGYSSVITKNRLTSKGFQIVYDEMKETLKKGR